MQFYSIPKWCKYIAQDYNGSWWAFEKEPVMEAGCRLWSTDGESQKITPVISSTLRKIDL